MYEIRRSSGASSLVEILLVLSLISAFLMIVAVVFVVKTFVKYSTHTSLWIALAVYVGCCIVAGVVYKLTRFDGSLVLPCIGVAVLLITCFAVDLKNRETLMRENVNLVDEVLHTSWWGSENTPLPETEQEQLAA